jgi:hypothetical protein
MIRNAKLVHVAKGKKIIRWDPQTDNREEILKTVMGPSGNLRAPTWQIDNNFLVGFGLELYQEVLDL